MNDYIEREAALSAQNKSMNLSECRKRIERIPAADVVPRDCYDKLLAENDRLRKERPVVRCGKCKHSVEHYDTDGNAPYWVCKEWDSGTDYDGYCHYGEKMDGGGDDGDG